MAIITKAHALNVIRRAYGPDFAESVAEHLPDRIDLDDPQDVRLLAERGLSRDGLFNALGGEL